MENYEIDYNDERFGKVESDKNQAMTELEQTYAGMINNSDKYYQDQINASKDWADKQSQLQQEQTDFTIEQVEQQKAQAQKAYTKEQSGAYVDWRKQSNEYGANAEQMASAGLAQTGFSESSQVSMYNTYQNRVATARESYNQAVLNYNNAIKDARLQNNAALAEIAYQALQQQLELSLQGFQYKNTLLLDKSSKKNELNQQYYSRYQDVLQQINTENALAEEIRQYNEKMAEEKRQYDENLALQKAKLEEEQRQFNAQMEAKASSSTRSSGGGGGGSSSKSSVSKSSSTKKDSSGAALDMKSVIDLGYGPISANALASKVASGEVIATQKGNTITVRKTPDATLKRGQSLLDKYTWVK